MLSVVTPGVTSIWLSSGFDKASDVWARDMSSNVKRSPEGGEAAGRRIHINPYKAL